MHIIKKSDSVF